RADIRGIPPSPGAAQPASVHGSPSWEAAIGFPSAATLSRARKAEGIWRVDRDVVAELASAACSRRLNACWLSTGEALTLRRNGRARLRPSRHPRASAGAARSRRSPLGSGLFGGGGRVKTIQDEGAA